MPLKERSGKLLREFININYKVINSQPYEICYNTLVIYKSAAGIWMRLPEKRRTRMMLLEMINGKKLAAVILAAVIGTAAVSGCGAPSASQDTAKETEATQAGAGATGAAKEDAEAEPAAEGASQDMASQSADEDAEAEPAAEGASQVTASQTADENAGVTAAVPEVSGQAGTEAIAEIPLSEEEMQQAFDSAVPYEDGFTVVIHSSNGDEIVLDSSEGTTLQGKTMPPVNGSDFQRATPIRRERWKALLTQRIIIPELTASGSIRGIRRAPKFTEIILCP